MLLWPEAENGDLWFFGGTWSVFLKELLISSVVDSIVLKAAFNIWGIMLICCLAESLMKKIDTTHSHSPQVWMLRARSWLAWPIIQHTANVTKKAAALLVNPLILEQIIRHFTVKWEVLVQSYWLVISHRLFLSVLAKLIASWFRAPYLIGAGVLSIQFYATLNKKRRGTFSNYYSKS